MGDFIIVSTSEDGEVTEFDLEDIGELSLSTLQSTLGKFSFLARAMGTLHRLNLRRWRSNQA